MSRLANDGKKDVRIRTFAQQLVKNLNPKDFKGEAQRIFYWVQKNIRYIKDVAGVETLATPLKTLEIKQGDCDDMAILLASLLMSIGHPCRFIAIGKERDVYTHVFAQTKIGPRWYSMEPTEPGYVFGQHAPGNWFIYRWNI